MGVRSLIVKMTEKSPIITNREQERLREFKKKSFPYKMVNPERIIYRISFSLFKTKFETNIIIATIKGKLLYLTNIFEIC